MHYHWGQTPAKKKEHGHFEQRSSSKKQCNFDSSWLEREERNLHSSQPAQGRRNDIVKTS